MFRFPIKCPFEQVYLLQNVFFCLKFDVYLVLCGYHVINLRVIGLEMALKETETLERVLNHIIEEMELFGLGTIVYYLGICLKDQGLFGQLDEHLQRPFNFENLIKIVLFYVL